MGKYEVIQFELNRLSMTLSNNDNLVSIFNNGSSFITGINYLSVSSFNLDEGDVAEFKASGRSFKFAGEITKDLLQGLLKFSIDYDIEDINITYRRIEEIDFLKD